MKDSVTTKLFLPVLSEQYELCTFVGKVDNFINYLLQYPLCLQTLLTTSKKVARCQRESDHRRCGGHEQLCCNFRQFMGARNRVGIRLSYGPPGYIGWRNRYLRIDSWAPDRDPAPIRIGIQGFEDQTIENFTLKNSLFLFFYQKNHLCPPNTDPDPAEQNQCESTTLDKSFAFSLKEVPYRNLYTEVEGSIVLNK
jgi:hypothetical protein